jgi:hypothetical protein
MPGAGGADAARIEASVAAPAGAGPGPADFRLSAAAPLPAGLALLDAAGQPVLGPDGTGMLSLAAGTPAQLSLRYDDAWAPAAPTRLELTLSAVSPYQRGSARLALTLAPVAAPLSLHVDGNTAAQPDDAFSVPVDDIDGEQGIFVAARGLAAPLEAAHLQLDSDPAAPVKLRIEAGRILIAPVPKGWSRCLNPAGDYPFRLDYSHPRTRQQASLTGTIAVAPVPWWQRCRTELAVLLILLLLLWKLLCKLRSESFPRYSHVIKINPGAASRAGAPKRPLHAWLRMPLLCGRERVSVYGLALVARSRGAGIRRHGKRKPPSLYHTGLAEHLPRAFAERRADELPWNWNESLVDDETGVRYLLVSDVRKQPESGY